MYAIGILDDDERVEVVDGQIITMARPGPRHATYVNRPTMLLTDAVRGKAIVSVQNPVLLDTYNFPMPDVAILRSSTDIDVEAYAGSDNILLVIEVSDVKLRSSGKGPSLRPFRNSRVLGDRRALAAH